ncbi:hypothetical protein AYI68_g270 [Smittium mucronatum]|uniref:Uncharacterized protein n=1 Tax=Smittium mucronatum TaxID=133383 RepID=A0A1R0H8U8_9FUNG|nr:hypothetical protein AYI68_g270 [Smittium mucronatum]
MWSIVLGTSILQNGQFFLNFSSKNFIFDSRCTVRKVTILIFPMSRGQVSGQGAAAEGSSSFFFHLFFGLSSTGGF